MASFRYHSEREGDELLGPCDFLFHLDGRYSVRFIYDWASVLSSSKSCPFEGALLPYYSDPDYPSAYSYYSYSSYYYYYYYYYYPSSSYSYSPSYYSSSSS
jgi:hypothetical protein